jgi:hypothetical protein
MPILPTIDVSIAASPAVFDIDGFSHLKIRLSLTLRHDRPITLHKRNTSLFDRKIIHDPGLTFTDIETGQQVPRNTIDICYFDNEGEISWATRRGYVTLYPGREHIVEKGFAPWGATEGEKKSSAASHLRWIRFAGFKDGQTYRIGISDEAVVGQWLQGTIWEILGWQMLGWVPTTEHANIPYMVVDSSVFTIKRADADVPPETLRSAIERI